MTKKYDYDIALSYASEDGDFVEKIAKCLKDAGVKVFFDRFMQAELWGENLYTHLDDVYRKRAHYCAIFISKNYVKKLWTSHERESAQARAFMESHTYLLPIRLDDTDLPGLIPTVAYVDARKLTPRKLCQIILKKLAT